jgi:hypothetical protein
MLDIFKDFPDPIAFLGRADEVVGLPASRLSGSRRSANACSRARLCTICLPSLVVSDQQRQRCSLRTRMTERPRSPL